MYLKLDESKWHKHTYEWSDRSKGIGRVDVYKGQIEVAEDVAPVVHAHWEMYRDETNCTYGNYACTNCHTIQGLMKYRYCPYCGAKMDEEAG